MKEPNDCGLRLKNAAAGSEMLSIAIVPPQYQRVLLWAIAHGPTANRNTTQTTRCTV